MRTLPEHGLIDRLVRGRGWIPLLGVMLAGIVAMQVELLKLNASIGRSIGLSGALQSRNDLLRASVSSLSDSQRIERLASGLDMVMPGPTSMLFLDSRRISAARAAADIHVPDPSGFESALAASAAVQSQSSGTPASATPASGPSSSAATPSPPAASATTTSAVPTQSTGQTPIATQPTGTATGPPAPTAPSGAAPTTSGAAPTTSAGAAPTTAPGATLTAGGHRANGGP